MNLKESQGEEESGQGGSSGREIGEVSGRLGKTTHHRDCYTEVWDCILYWGCFTEVGGLYFTANSIKA